jgi:hypothetical protein
LSRPMSPRRVDLQEIANSPNMLLERGYVRKDEYTTDTLRSVIFEKAIASSESQLKLLVQIHFELAISDNVGYDYEQNCSYSFNRVHLEVINRQMERENNRYFDEESEDPISVGTLKLDIESLAEVERLVRLLKPHVSLW